MLHPRARVYPGGAVDSGKLARGEACEADALAGQVSLVGVAGIKRGPSQVVPLGGEEAA